MAGFALAEEFIAETKERSDLNQYWYSPGTIETLVSEIQDLYDAETHDQQSDATRNLAALVSCPSIYFALPVHLRKKCVVLDLDTQWSSDPGYHCFDFNISPNEQLPLHLRHSFKLVVVDPPFVTREVWEQYADSSIWLGSANECRYICTTIHENAAMMKSLLNVSARQFRPSIPNLVYQYSTYTNYNSQRLDALNPEIDQIDWKLAAAEHDEHAMSSGSKSSCQDDRKISKLSRNEDWKSMPVVESKTSFPAPPEIEALIHLRTSLGSLKSSVSDVNKATQQLILNLQSKNSHQRRKKVTETLQKLSQKVESVCLDWENNVVPMQNSFGDINAIEIASHTDETNQLIADVEHCFEHEDNITKSNLTRFITRNKKNQQNVFRKMGVILSLIKRLKTKK
jgi:hypothetical protein